MNVSAKTMKHLLEQHKGDSEAMARGLDRYAAIEGAVAQVRIARKNAQEQLAAAHRSLDERLKSIQEGCDHPDWKEHRDPDGGWKECVVCGVSV